MRKIAAAGFIALCIAESSSAYAQKPLPAQTPPAAQASSVDLDSQSAEMLKAFTDMRVDVVKSALQLRPEQNQMWPAIEAAIRERSAARHARLMKITAQRNTTANRTVIELMRDRAS